MCFSGKLRVKVGAVQKVEGEEGVGEELAPEMERKSGVNAGEPGNEMAFESVNGLLSRVGVVIVGGGQAEKQHHFW